MVSILPSGHDWLAYSFDRLLGMAPAYFDLAEFPNEEAKSALKWVANKEGGKARQAVRSKMKKPWKLKQPKGNQRQLAL